MDAPEISKKFTIGKKIGSVPIPTKPPSHIFTIKIIYSEVYEALDLINNRKCSLKIFNKKEIKKDLMNNYKNYESEEIENEFISVINSIKNEKMITEICKSKNTVELYEYLETEDLIILSMELYETDLDNFNKKMSGNLNDNINLIQNIFNDLNNAIEFLYQKKIMHRDIKLENIYLKFEENGKIITKLGDFGISTIYNTGQEFSDRVGIPLYMASEILKGDIYNYKCDLYSIGVCLYKLIFKEFPFKGTVE